MNVIRLLKIKTADSAWLYRNVAKCDPHRFVYLNCCDTCWNKLASWDGYRNIQHWGNDSWVPRVPRQLGSSYQGTDTLQERAWEPKSFVTSLLADKIEAEGTPFESED